MRREGKKKAGPGVLGYEIEKQQRRRSHSRSPLPGQGEVENSPIPQRFIQELSRRAEAIRAKKAERKSVKTVKKR